MNKRQAKKNRRIRSSNRSRQAMRNFKYYEEPASSYAPIDVGYWAFVENAWMTEAESDSRATLK